MLWLLAFFAAVVGAVLAAEVEGLFGFMATFLVVAAIGLILRQTRRHDALERQVRALQAAIALASKAPDPAPGAAPAPAQDAAPSPVPAPIPRPAPPPIPGAEEPPAPPPIPEAEPPAPAPRPEPSPRPTASVLPTAAPATPDAIEHAVARTRAFFFEGNVPVKLGLLVSLFGVAALIRYAASAGWLFVPVSMRYAGIALAAIALLAYGMKQVRERPVFGLSLQGGAIGILLLTVFGSYRVPGLLPAALAFGLVLALVAGAAVLAIRQNAVWLAVIGFLGGYLAPLLLSTGSADHVALFSYYALLNAAVFGMAWVRPWRALNLIGFAFTFGVGAIWGGQYFEPALFATTEPFLIAFFLMYVAIPVLYALKGREPGKVDATLLFGTPLIAFPMQVALLDGEAMPLAFSALAVAGIYLLLALWSRREAKLRVLGQSAAALGLVFATLAVPLALSARWTSATWALQGVALLWLGQVQARRWPQVAGVALQALAGIAYLAAFDASLDARAVFNPHTMNLLLLVLGAGASAWLFDRAHPSRQSAGAALLAVVASGWWFWAGAREIDANLAANHFGHGPAWLGFIALTCATGATLHRFLAWRKPTWWAVVGLLSALPAVALAQLKNSDWAWQAQGFVLVALAAGMAMALPSMRGMTARLATAHIAGLAALTLAVGLAIHSGLDAINANALGDGWRWVVPWLPLAALAAALALRPRLAAWPVGDQIEGYRRIAIGLAAFVLGTLWIVTQAVAGQAEPLPWIPVLNPVELFQGAGLIALWAWVRAQPIASTTALLGRVAFGAAGFTMLSMVTLRAAWQWIGDGPEPWSVSVDWSTVAATPAAQAALSIVWSTVGVLAWVIGSRRHSRALWSFGALLLAVVLLKLLLVDRSNLGDLLGIVSFLAVGGLLVLVGRLAPRPPSRRDVQP